MAAAQFAAERPEHTLQPTALVHEAFLRMHRDPNFVPRRFFAAAAEAMRRILVDHARKKRTRKRGGNRARLPLDAHEPMAGAEHQEDLLALDEALADLERDHPEKAQVVKLRYFGGLTLPQVADTLAVSLSTVEKRWTYARAWLFQRLTE